MLARSYLPSQKGGGERASVLKLTRAEKARAGQKSARFTEGQRANSRGKRRAEGERCTSRVRRARIGAAARSSGRRSRVGRTGPIPTPNAKLGRDRPLTQNTRVLHDLHARNHVRDRCDLHRHHTALVAVNPCGVGRFAPLIATLAALVWRVGRGREGIDSIG
jgi:hypothetical protein